MASQPDVTSPDGSSNGNPPERCSRPLYSWDSTQEDPEIPQERWETPQEDEKNMNVLMVKPHLKEEEEEVPINIGQGDPHGNALQKHPKYQTSKKSCTEEDDEKEMKDDGVNEDATPRLLKTIVKSEEEEVTIKEEENAMDLTPVDLQKQTSQDHRTANDTKSKDHLTAWNDVSGWSTKTMTHSKILTINHRTASGDKPFSCTECGGFFKHKSSLVLHRRIHSGEKPYSCSECGKQFIQKANYLRHQRLHTGEKPYKCTECGKEYAQKQSLVMHQKFHAENEPFSCPECDANFIRQSHLVNHRKTHKGFRRYTCPDCGDFFMLRSSLVIHQRVHSAEKSFSS